MPVPFWLDETNGEPFDKANLWFNVDVDPEITLTEGKYILGVPETILPEDRLKSFKKGLKNARAKSIRFYRDKGSDVYAFDKAGLSIYVESVLPNCKSRSIELPNNIFILTGTDDINPGRLNDVCRITVAETMDVRFIEHGKEDYYMTFDSQICQGRADIVVQRLS